MDEDDFGFYDANDGWSYREDARRRRLAWQSRTAAGSGRFVIQPPQQQAVPRTTSTEVSVMNMETRKRELAKMLAEFAGLQALADRFSGSQPPVGTVLRWVRLADGGGELRLEGVGTQDEMRRALAVSVSRVTEFVYVAFRAPDGKWYKTGRGGASLVTWDALLEEIGDNECHIASEWTEVPAPERVDESAIDPTEWARAAFGKKDAPKADTPGE